MAEVPLICTPPAVLANLVARTAAADEVLLAAVESHGESVRVSLRRISGRDGRVLGAEAFPVTADPVDLRLLADAVNLHLRKAYPKYPPRPGALAIEVQDGDYAAYLALRLCLGKDVETTGPAQDLEFTVEVEVMPDISLPDFSTLQLTRLKAEVAPERVDESLADMARRNRELVDITAEELGDRGAEKGEVLTIDYAGKIDGQPFPGGEGTGVDVEVGGSGFIAGFSEQMEGMKPGETRTIEVTFPEEYFSKDLAGKPASFEITAHRLRRQVLPEINDEFAQKLAFENADELRDMMKRRIQQEYDSLSRLRLKRELLDALTEHADFAAPEGIVEQEFQQIWQRLEAERREGRLDEEDQGKDEDTLRADYRDRGPAGAAGADAGRDRPGERHPGHAGRDDPGDAVRGRALSRPRGGDDGVLPQVSGGGEQPARADLRRQSGRLRAGAGPGHRPDGALGGAGQGAARRPAEQPPASGKRGGSGGRRGSRGAGRDGAAAGRAGVGTRLPLRPGRRGSRGPLDFLGSFR